MGKGNTFYGVALATYPLARIFVLPLAGLAADRGSMRSGLLVTLSMQIVGCTIYGCAQGAGQPLFIIFGRLFAGCGSTNNAMVQKFVVETSSMESRSKQMARLQAINLVGIALGPATNFIIANTDFQLAGPVMFNTDTGAGFMMVVFHVFNTLLMLALFHDPPAPLAAEGPGPDASCGVCRRLLEGFTYAIGLPGGAGVMVIGACAMMWLSLLEALVTPIARASFHWSLQEISIFFAIFALVAAVLMLIIGFASKWLQDRTLISASLPFYVSAVVMFLLVMPEANSVSKCSFFLVGSLISIGFTCQNATSISLFTKLMRSTKHEGVTSSIVLQAQGSGRVLGPLLGGLMLDHGGLKGCGYVLSVLLLFQLVLVWLNWGPWDTSADAVQDQNRPGHVPPGHQFEELGP